MPIMWTLPDMRTWWHVGIPIVSDLPATADAMVVDVRRWLCADNYNWDDA